MRYLLDSHVLIYAADNPTLLSPDARQTLEDPTAQLVISTGTLWEIAIKVCLGKLRLSLPYSEWMGQIITGLDIKLLDISIDDGQIVSNLPFHHRDPFDRLLVAQTISNKLTLISSDAMFDSYGIPRKW